MGNRVRAGVLPIVLVVATLMLVMTHATPALATDSTATSFQDDSYEFSTDENTAANTVVGTVVATDPDGDSLTYSVGGTDEAAFNEVFALNASTGVITVKPGASVNYERKESYSVNIMVTDGKDDSGATQNRPTADATVSVFIPIVNIDEPGTVTLSTSSPREGVALSATLTDPDGRRGGILNSWWSRAHNASGPFFLTGDDYAENNRNMTYTPKAADRYMYIKFHILYMDKACPYVSNLSSITRRCTKTAERVSASRVEDVNGHIVQRQVNTNNPATGDVRITHGKGVLQPGYHLNADVYTIRDADGTQSLKNGLTFLTWKWFRIDPVTERETQVPGWQHGSYWAGIYVVKDVDRGRGIQARVSFLDDLGNTETLRGPVHRIPAPDNNAATGSPVIAGTAQVGETLSADTSGISDVDGFDTDTLTYQWYANDGAGEMAIEGATGSTYTLEADDAGKTITVYAIFTDQLGYSEVSISTPTVTVTAAPTAPTVNGTPRVSGSGNDGSWTVDENVEVTVSFSEAVEVVTTNGTPSIGIGLGGTAARSATYRSGSGTAALVFRYTLVTDDGSHNSMAVTPNSLVLGGGVIRSAETQVDALLAHNGTVVQARTAGQRKIVRSISPQASFQNVPESHDGVNGFTVGLRFSGTPAQLSAETDAASVLEVTGGTVTGARQTVEGANPVWEVTITPNGPGEDVTVRVPVRACSEMNAVCIGGQPLSEATEVVVPGPPMTASFTQSPASHDGSTRGFDLHMDFSHEPNNFSYRMVREALFDLEGGRIGRVWRRDGERNRLWRIEVIPDGQGSVMLTARVTTDCAVQHAVCDADGRKFAGNLRLMVPGPQTLPMDSLPMVSIARSTSPVTEGAAAAFTLARTGAVATVLTVAVKVSKSAGMVSVRPPTSVMFAAGSASATLSVATDDDEATEDASTVTAAVMSGSGYTLDETSMSAEVVVNDDDAAPVVSTASPIMVAENVTAVATLTATDADTAAGDLSWSIPAGADGGADRAMFALTADGALSFKAAKNFEAPDDADADGDYEITVRVTDGANPVDASLVVRLSTVEGAAPVVATVSPIVVAENATAVATLTATDADTAAGDLSWSIPAGADGGADSAMFALTADGALSFKVAKDFEAPDDADADGDYEITVRVTDGANPVDASLVVRLSDVDDAAPVVATVSPIVVAENATAVATLTATDADTAAGDLSWSIPAGADGGADSAMFALTADGALSFKVAKDFEAPDDADADGDYEITVRVTDGANPVDASLVVRLSDVDDGSISSPQASFQNVPEGHDGENGFTVGLRFSGTPAQLSAETDAASVLEVTGGTVTGARQTAEDVNPAWEVTVTPNGLGDVTVRVPVRACIETNAVCIGGQPLSEVAKAVVPGTSMAASFTQAPAAHDGSNSFDLHMEFSHEPNNFSYRTVRDALFDLEDGRIERVWRRERGKNRLWGITVVPDGQGPVTLTARATTDCTAQYAACDTDGRKFAGNLRLTVPGPRTLPMVSIARSTSPVTEGTAAAFTLSRTGATDAALTVEVSVAETGAAVSGTPSTSVTFAAGSASATLSVATEDDEAEEDASTVTATVASGSGYTVDGASGSADVVVDDDDAAPVVTTASPLVVAENATAVATLAATDADTADEDLAWSIPEGAAGGTDAAQFALTAAGELTFGSAKDFEAPDDADADGDYEVTVRVTDGANPVDAALVVRLTDADDVAPALTGASVDGDELTLTYSEALDGDSVPPESSFAVTVGDSARTVDAAAVSGSTVVLTLSSEVLSGETVTVGYTVPTGADAKPVKDTAGNAVATFTKAPVTNAAATLPVVSIAPSTTPVTEGTAAAFTLSRTGATDAALTVEVSVAETGAAVSGAPPTSVSFDVGSDSATLSVATEDDEAVEDASTVTATVSSGEGYTVDGTSGAAEVVVDDDDAAPVVSTASPIEVAENATAVATLAATDVDTAAEDLAWSVPEGAAGGVDAAQFALTADGALTFKAAKDFEAPDDADADGDYEITVRVTDGANQVDASLVVRLTDTDDAAPTLLSASVDGATVTLTFGEALDEDSKPPASALAVRVGETARTVEAVAISGSTALLTLSPAVTPEETVTVDYAVPEDPEAMALQDAAGNRVASFAATEVENGTAPALPTVSIAAVSTPVTEGAAAAFVLRRTGTGTAELTVTVSVSEAGSVLDGAPPSSATFASGSAEARLNVATANDAIDEADGRVSASIVAGDGYEVDGESASAGVDVFDDDAAAQAAVELWSTTMTWTDIGNNWFGGFADGFSNPGWSEDGQAFRIWFISYEAGSRVLSMAHDGSGGVIAEPGQLTLHVGGLTVGPGEAISTFAGAGYARLGDVDSQWQVGGQVTVRLTRASGDADAAPAGPGLSVADAQVNEAAGAPLRFRVTLDAPAESTVSVRYRTSDGTAQAGADYVAAHGTVRFARGETAKTVEVAVLPDDHDEGSETMTLTLSGPYGATVADGTATGTISNTGAIPKAWIARFGRTVAEQAIEAVEARFEAPHVPGLSGTIGGQSISGVSGPESEAGEAWGAGADARQGLEALSGWFGGEGGDEDELGFGTRTLSGGEVLTGTSFGFTAGSVETGFASFWGRGAVTSFDGRDGGMTLDGEVASAMLGADFSRDALLGGLMLSHSRGEGGYRSPDGNGEVESTLTALFPYVRYAFSERVSVWGMAGYGEGTLTVTPEGQAPLSPDMDFLMGALGVRGVLLDGGHDGPTLAAKSDAFAVRTSTDAVSGSAGNLEASQADVTRVRFALEGSRPFGLGGDAVLTPSLELGVRHDDGDAETGFGADIGAGLVLSDPVRGISAEVRARGLLTHEAEGMRERGLSGTLAFDPAPDTERGLSLSLTQSVGVQGEGGVDALLKRRTFADLGAEEEDDLSARRLDALIGYGIGVFEDRYTATPELGLGLSDRDRELRLGWRLTEQVGTGLAFEFGLEGTRREFTEGDAGPEHGLGLGFGWRLAGRGTAAFDMRVEAVRLVSANDDEAPQDQVGFRATARW